jgi:glutamyl-tRNA synthetase
MREKARAEGKTRLYNGLWRDRDPADAPAGVKPAIRLKAPLSGETAVEDQVQGRVVWQNENLDDLVLLRSDRPTCSPSWSTTMTWASPTSSAATTT